MKYRTVLVQCAVLISLLVRPSHQHDYKSNGISGSSSQSFSSASASSFASAGSYSSSSSFGGKSGDLNNEVGEPLGNLLSGAKASAAVSLPGIQAGSSAFANAGAQAGVGGIGAGANSKASAGSKSGVHGLGVGGGIGIGNDGTIEGTGKYGSAAIKGTCAGGSCSNGAFGFGGSGSYSGSGGFNAGNSAFSGNANTHGNPGGYSNGNSNFGSTQGTSGANAVLNTSLNGCGGTSGSCKQDSAATGSIGCAHAPGGCDKQYPSNIQPQPNGSVNGLNPPSGIVTGSSSPCGSSNPDCTGGIVGVHQPSPSGSAYPDYLTRPLGTGAAGGSVDVTKPNVLPGFQTPLSHSSTNIPLNNHEKAQVLQPKPSYSPVLFAKPHSYNTGSYGTDFSYHDKPVPSIGILIPSTGIQIPAIGVDAVYSVATGTESHYTGPFPGPSLSIHHSIPASSIPVRPNAGASVGSGIGLGISIDSNAPSGSPVATIYEGHYTGPFPGPSGSIYQHKLTTFGKPSFPFESSKPSYANAGSVAQAGATSSSGTHYTGPFSGPGGSIHQNTNAPGSFYGNKPVSTISPSVQHELSKPSYAGTGSTANAQAGATSSGGTHYTGPFPGPAGSIYQSTNVPNSSYGNKAVSTINPSVQYEPSQPSFTGAGSTGNAQAGTTGSTGTHYTGPFPGPAGSIHQSTNAPGSPYGNKPVSTISPSVQYEPSKPSYAGAGSTANAQAGSTGSTGTHYTGPFPGPAGSIHQSTNAPGSSYENKPIWTGIPDQYEPSKPSNAGAGSTANTQTGATVFTGTTGTHYTGPFPGPSGSIHQSTNVPVSSYGTKRVSTGQPSVEFESSTSSYAGSHYTGSFSGSTGNDSPSGVTYSSGLTGGTTGGHAKKPIGSTVFTEKPIINIIPVTHSNDGKAATTDYAADNSVSKTTTTGYIKQTGANSGAYSDSKVQTKPGNDCAYEGCSPPLKQDSPCEGSSCKIPNYESGSQSPPHLEPAGGCSGPFCGSPALQAGVVGGNSADAGLNAGNSICSGRDCTLPTEELRVHSGSGGINIVGGVDSSASAGGLGSQNIGCQGLSCATGLGGGTANANAGSAASAGSHSSHGPTPIGTGSYYDGSAGTYDNGYKGCGSPKCDIAGGNLGSDGYSGASSSSFGGSFSSAKSGSSSYSGAKGGSASHSFATSGSSSGGFGFPIDGFGEAQSGAYSSSYASAKSSASSGHY